MLMFQLYSDSLEDLDCSTKLAHFYLFSLRVTDCMVRSFYSECLITGHLVGLVVLVKFRLRIIFDKLFLELPAIGIYFMGEFPVGGEFFIDELFLWRKPSLSIVVSIVVSFKRECIMDWPFIGDLCLSIFLLFSMALALLEGALF